MQMSDQKIKKNKPVIKK